MKTATFLPLMVLLVWGVPAAAEEADERGGTPPPSIEFKPAVVMDGEDVIILVRLTPDEKHRWLSVAVESPSYFSSTGRELRGAASPGTHRFAWRTLPADSYDVTVEVRSATGEVQTADRVLLVYGPGQSTCVTESGGLNATCDDPGARPIGGRR